MSVYNKGFGGEMKKVIGKLFELGLLIGRPLL